MVASTWIMPGCVQFLENKKRFHTAWVKSGGRLSIDLPEHNIERTDDRRDVGQHVAAAQEIHCLQVREGGRPDLAFVGLIGAIRDEIDTELTLGRLNSCVNLTGRNTMTFTI